MNDHEVYFGATPSEVNSVLAEAGIEYLVRPPEPYWQTDDDYEFCRHYKSWAIFTNETRAREVFDAVAERAPWELLRLDGHLDPVEHRAAQPA